MTSPAPAAPPPHHHRTRGPILAAVLALALVIAMATGASVAMAGTGLGVGSNIPGSADNVTHIDPVTHLKFEHVGEHVLGDVNFFQNFTGQNTGDIATVDFIHLVPSCGPRPTGAIGGIGYISGDPHAPCINPNVGIYAMSPTGVGIDCASIPGGYCLGGTVSSSGAGSGCVGVTFDISPTPGIPGQYDFVPRTPVTLANNQTCLIQFAVDVLRAPAQSTFDTGPYSPPVNGTSSVAGAQTTITTSPVGNTGLHAAGSGSDGGAALMPIALPLTTTAAVAAGGTFSDTATFATPPNGAVAPTGSVTFNVFKPSDTTCAGPPAFTSTNALNGTLLSVASDAFRASAASGGPGTYRFTAAYSGDVSYTPVSSACNDANEQATIPAPVIGVVKTVAPSSLPAPGGNFTFTATVSNPSTTDAIKITSIVDDKYGDLATRAGSTCGPLIGTTLAPGATSAPCSFAGPFTGAAGANQTDTITVGGIDVNGFTATAAAHATVTLTPGAAVQAATTPVPAISVTKAPTPSSLPAPGGNFTFAVTVTNTSSEPLTLTSLTDNVYGNLNGKGTCVTGGALPVGGTYKCSFTGKFTGSAGASQMDTVTPVATDSGGRTATATANARVTLTPGAKRRAATATRLTGPIGCAPGAFRVTVFGSAIRRVTFTLNGRIVATAHGRSSSGGYTVIVQPGGHSGRLTARVTYTDGRAARTLTRAYSPCRTPRFTG